MKAFLCFSALVLCMGGQRLAAQTWEDSVVVLPVKYDLPEGAKKISHITVGNNSTSTRCDYEALVYEAKEKAHKKGGNIVKITKLVPPSFISKCYKIDADVYYATQLPLNKKASAPGAAATTPKYATLYIYRLPDTLALITPYKLHMNGDTVICTVKSKWKDSVNVYTEGPVTLWAETGRKTQLKINVQYGQGYYIRCGLVMGDIRMVPVLELMDKSVGAAEYKKLGAHKKNMDVNYLYEIH